MTQYPSGSLSENSCVSVFGFRCGSSSELSNERACSWQCHVEIINAEKEETVAGYRVWGQTESESDEISLVA